MKKKLAILFLAVLFVSQIGYYFVYLFQQYQIKEAVKEQLLATIPDDQLIQISLDKNARDIEWEEEGHEFFLDGKMYDVARIKNVNGEQVIFCINDEKEEALLDKLSQSVASASDQGPNGKDSSHHTIKFQITDFLIPLQDKISIIVKSIAQPKYAFYDVAILTIIKEVDLPPPKLYFMSKFYLL